MASSTALQPRNVSLRAFRGPAGLSVILLTVETMDNDDCLHRDGDIYLPYFPVESDINSRKDFVECTFRH